MTAPKITHDMRLRHADRLDLILQSMTKWLSLVVMPLLMLCFLLLAATAATLGTQGMFPVVQALCYISLLMLSMICLLHILFCFRTDRRIQVRLKIAGIRK